MLQVASALYLLQRLMCTELLDDGTDFKSAFSSSSVVAVFFMFLCLTYSLRMIERLQNKQIALLAAQKFQIYFKRITWHPDEDSTREQSEGGDVDPCDADFGTDSEALPEFDDDEDVVDDSSDEEQEVKYYWTIHADGDHVAPAAPESWADRPRHPPGFEVWPASRHPKEVRHPQGAARSPSRYSLPATTLRGPASHLV